MGGQLDEHLLFWHPTISIILYRPITAQLLIVSVLRWKYDNDDDDDKYYCYCYYARFQHNHIQCQLSVHCLGLVFGPLALCLFRAHCLQAG